MHAEAEDTVWTYYQHSAEKVYFVDCTKGSWPTQIQVPCSVHLWTFGALTPSPMVELAFNIIYSRRWAGFGSVQNVNSASCQYTSSGSSIFYKVLKKWYISIDPVQMPHWNAVCVCCVVRLIHHTMWWECTGGGGLLFIDDMNTMPIVDNEKKNK